MIGRHEFRVYEPPDPRDMTAVELICSEYDHYEGKLLMQEIYDWCVSTFGPRKPTRHSHVWEWDHNWMFFFADPKHVMLFKLTWA
jgi:hypothetical protein